MNLTSGTSTSFSAPLTESTDLAFQKSVMADGEIKDPLSGTPRAFSSLTPELVFASVSPVEAVPVVRGQVSPDDLVSLGVQPLPAPVVVTTPSSSAPIGASLTGQIVFIDSSLPNYQSLIAGAIAGVNVVALDPKQDGIAQITQVLAQSKDVSAVHIVSLGRSGTLKLGAALVTSNSLDVYKRSIQKWAASFTPGADILLYGSDIGAGDVGESFTHKFSEIAQAAVAASNDRTGKNGDWVLEVNTEAIATKIAFQSSVTSDYAASFDLV